MELTKEYFDKQLKNLTTKDDLKGLTTKVDSIDAKVDTLKQFVQKHLVTKAELKEALATLPTRRQIDKLTTAVEKLATQTKDYKQEVSVLHSRISEMEKWIEQVAPKIGIAYKV